jgi:hypothetical protein
VVRGFFKRMNQVKTRGGVQVNGMLPRVERRCNLFNFNDQMALGMLLQE